MKKIIVTTIGLASLMIAVAISGGTPGQTLHADCKFQPSSLEGKSLKEIESAALDYVCAAFKSVGPAPRILLNRKISPKEYMFFFGGTQALCKDQQLALIILEGNFEQINVLGSTSVPPSAKYVALLFDLKLGIPTSTSYSKTGEGFAEILKDPSLPPNKSRLAPPPKKLRECTYGQTAPTITPPNQ